MFTSSIQFNSKNPIIQHEILKIILQNKLKIIHTLGKTSMDQDITNFVKFMANLVSV